MHHALMGTAMGLCAAAGASAPAFGLRGLPHWPHGISGSWTAWMAAAYLLWELLDALVERRGFRSAVPLADPDAVLPADDTLRHHLVDSCFFLFMLVPPAALGLVWGPWGALVGLPLAVSWLFDAVNAALWERKHGLLVWRGEVEAQPLGKGRYFYSSPARPGPDPHPGPAAGPTGPAAPAADPRDA
ncbi:hypothetical protein [Actinacidiphila rubida]|uniref:hypothetical protein n=1 Tax=Actinacidiphila rubida TaxID=310780 RepID=UPI0008496EDB|nr:hypothetical protein [Actinacidiphila rubida]